VTFPRRKKEPHRGDIIAARGFNPWNKMPDFDFGFWPSARQSIKNVSPKTEEVDCGNSFSHLIDKGL
jgi:hypothetical protein